MLFGNMKGLHLSSRRRFMAIYLIVICACANVTSSFNEVFWKNIERIQRQNCTKCKAHMERNVQEVLPRLTIIKEKILNAIGRNPSPQRELPSSMDAIETRHAPELPRDEPVAVKIPQRAGYRMEKIVSYPESDKPGKDQDETIFKFRIHGNGRGAEEEAMGASLLLFMDRRRKIRTGGRGKKIILEISKLSDKNIWESLTYLQTRVKKRRWKRVSLPIKSVQEFLESDDRNIELKVRCLGCGRLVNIVLNKQSKNELTHRKRRTHSKRSRKSNTKDTRGKRRNNRLKRKDNSGGSPFLIISTRVRI
ncbi:hypothetical protein ACF0H5_018086 [Mactra antiquata]